MRRTVWTGAALVLAPLALVACEGERAEVSQASDEVSGLSAANGRLILPATSAAAAGVYFDLAYGADQDRGIAINRVSVEKAQSAELHEYVEYDFQIQMVPMMQLTMQPGDEISLKSGEQHVMAMGLADDVKVGDTLDVTLTVAGGKTFTFPVEVVPANAER